VTVVGIDGATWRVIDPLLARGDLPHMASLIAGGVRAPLRSQTPLVSPAVWTTIATGVSRKRHGIKDFRGADGALVRSTDRRAPALWTLASDAGFSSAVIGWWATYPAEIIAGVVVSERALKVRVGDVRDMLKGGVPEPRARALAHPPGALAVVADLVGRAPRIDGTGGADDPAYWTGIPHRMRIEDAAVARSLVRLRRRMGPFDLEMVLLRGVDPVSHFFWKFHEPDASIYRDLGRPSPEEVARYGDTIENHYRYVDRLLGALGARGGRDHVVVLLSDHGFEPGPQPFPRGGTLSGTHVTLLAMDGILVASGGPVRPGGRLEQASILDVAPTLLHLLGLPVSAELEGRVLTDALEPAWSTAHPVTTVPRYDLPPPATVDAPDSPADHDVEEELRALGYVE
jgi:predicted AlkP superfamily phosphohydrolase/phosphomutase